MSEYIEPWDELIFSVLWPKVVFGADCLVRVSSIEILGISCKVDLAEDVELLS